METTQHAPGPWHIYASDEYIAGRTPLNFVSIWAGEGRREHIVANDIAAEDAKFIVTACNAHYELLEACRMALADESTSSKVAKACYAAIANAGALTPISAQGKE